MLKKEENRLLRRQNLSWLNVRRQRLHQNRKQRVRTCLEELLEVLRVITADPRKFSKLSMIRNIREMWKNKDRRRKMMKIRKSTNNNSAENNKFT
jgi:hypothetical protein